ncbi:O-antigen ligase family protein [Pseudobythopirellula maris]|nr:O-antigen ligase family protein [Pseudobythopirellula maris]
MLFFVVAERLRSRQDVERLLTLVAIAAASMAFLALFQHLTSNGKLLWIYSHPYRKIGATVQGVFANKNHFAQFATLGLAPLVWLALRPREKTKPPAASVSGDPFSAGLLRGAGRFFRIAAVLVVVFAVLLSLSRGGAIAMGVSAAVLCTLLWRVGWITPAQLLPVALLGTAIVGAASLYNDDAVSRRLDDFASGSIEQLDKSQGRRLIWQANVDAFQANPWFGYGIGSHREIYPTHFPKPFRNEYTHAESGYLQVATEAGLAGILLLVSAIGCCLYWLVSAWRQTEDGESRVLVAVAAAGIAASLAHSVVDFVWFIPACMAMVVALAACAMRLSQGVVAEEPQSVSRRGEITLIATRPWAAAAVAMASLAMLVGPASGSLTWDEYLRRSVAFNALVARQASATASEDPYYEETLRHNVEAMIAKLESVVEHDPHNARAQLRLAARRLQLFDLLGASEPNDMPLHSICDAAIASEFSSKDETVAWLSRAFGPRADLLIGSHDSARRAVELCPLQGEAYTYLAALRFLSPPDQRDVLRMVDRALAVRPYDGEVLYETGKIRMLAGDEQGAIDLWRESARRPGAHRLNLVSLIASHLPASFLIDRLDPDWQTCQLAFARYQIVGDEADLDALAEHAKSAIDRLEGDESPERVALYWRQLSSIQLAREDLEGAVFSAETAHELTPSDFHARLALATALYKSERFADADPHLRWCLARRPDIRCLKNWLVQSTKRQTQVDKNRRLRKSTFDRVALLTETPQEESDTPPETAPGVMEVVDE